MSVAKRVSEEYGCRLGREPGCWVVMVVVVVVLLLLVVVVG